MSGNAGTTTRVQPSRIADADRRLYHVFIRDLVVPCLIGIHDHEREAPQRVRLNLDLAVHEVADSIDDDYVNVVCYEKIAEKVRNLIGRGHVNLVETLAEDVAVICLANIRVHSVRVRVEKLDIMTDAASVGVEIERISSPG